MGGGSSSNSGSSVTTSTSASSVNSSHTNHNEFGSQAVNIHGDAGAGTTIAFSNLAAFLGQDSSSWTPQGLPQR